VATQLLAAIDAIACAVLDNVRYVFELGNGLNKLGSGFERSTVEIKTDPLRLVF